MLQAQQPARQALQCASRARRFSTTAARPALSPYRKLAQSQNSSQQHPARRNVSDTASRPAQAAASPAAARAVPSPAFNRDQRIKEVQPLKPFRQPEMDHSFVGMTGGEIVHEMMLRHNVKHVFGYPGGILES